MAKNPENKVLGIDRETAGNILFPVGIIGMLAGIIALRPEIVLLGAGGTYTGSKWRKGEGVLQFK